MQPTAPKPLVELIVARLIERAPDLLAVYRFGSFGTPAQRPDSDIDLELLGEAPLEPLFLFDLAGELATLAHREDDLIDLITCSAVLRAQVIATGERMFCRDRTRCEAFATTAFSRYAHLDEARRAILDDIAARGAVHGRRRRP